MTDYHQAHEAYIGAVAAALEAAGFEVKDWFADPNDPRDGAIELRPVGKFAADELWLGWQEERAWTVLTVGKGKGWNKRDRVPEDSRYVYDVGVELLASPESVVREFAAMASVDAHVPPDRHPDRDFPDHTCDDEDDPEFEAALAAYRQESER